MRFAISLEWLDGREEILEVDGYCIQPKDSTVVIQIGQDAGCTWRVHHLSQFKNVEIQPATETKLDRKVMQ